MGRGNSVRVVGQFDDKISSPLDKLRDRFDQLGKSKGAQSILQGVGVGAGISAWNMVGSAVGKVTDVLGDSINAYRTEEVSIAKLNASVVGNTEGWQNNRQAVEALLLAREKLGFSDDEQRDSLGNLVAAYGDLNVALERQRVAMDLARFAGVDLATADDALIKIHAGNFRALKSLGLNTKNVKDETEALAFIMKVAGGQAAAFATTDLGKLEAATVKVDDAEEKLGQTFSHLEAIVLPAVTDGLTEVVNVLDVLNGASPQLATIDDAIARDVESGNIVDLQRDLAALQGGIDKLNGSPLAPFFPSTIAANVEPLERNLARVQDALDRARGSGKYTDDMFLRLAKSELSLQSQTDDTAGAVDHFQDKLDLGADAASAMNKSLKGLETTLFGTAIAAGDLAQAQGDVIDATKNHSEAQAALAALLKDEPQNKNSRAWRAWKAEVATARLQVTETNGALAEQRQALFDLQFQQKQAEGPQALLDWLKKQREALGKTNTAARTLLDTYITWAQLQLNPKIVGNKSFIAKATRLGLMAEGGALREGEAAIVGEGGAPELARQEGGRTVITPLGDGGPVPVSTVRMSLGAPAAGAGGAVVIHNHFESVWPPTEQQARAIAEVVDRQLYYRRSGSSLFPRG